MSARYLLVDGHSVIFAWGDLRAVHNRNRALARRQLADGLTQLHDTTSWRVTLVLDGKLGTAPGDPSAKPGDMVVVYATADQTADSIIERLVAASGKAPEVLVVTADEAERRTVEALGAMTASPTWLREEMVRERLSFSDAMNRINRAARWR